MQTQSHMLCSRKNLFALFFSLIISLSFNYSNAQFSCAGLSTTNIGYTGAPQTFVVPTGVSQVRISLTGASGGQASGAANTAGGGATVYAYINVVPGDVFRVIIGQKGINGTMEAGGGGSSAVYKNGVLIMVAGAGGGEDNTGNGGNGVATEDGLSGGSDSGTTGNAGCGTSPDNGRAGTAGQGGNHGEFSANCPHGGGGGGGLLSPGLGNGNLNAGQPGGQGNINGAAGGAGALDDAAATHGGWGWSGGGGADMFESGGGGGYSGGGGGPESRHPGGGGSFVAAIGTDGITVSDKADGTGTTTGFDGSAIVCSSPAITLPVNFGSFTAETTTGGAFLQWTTATEINTAYYEIERSTDGISFTVIGTVLANGQAGTYHFTDNTAGAGKTYYRIKAVDADHKLSYSATRFINSNQQQVSLTAYPSPAKDKISIVLPQSWQRGTTQLTLINTNGQVVLSMKTTLLQNDINTSALPTGVYLVKAVNDQAQEQRIARFVK